MYQRPRFLEILIQIREEMAREADFDLDLFVENVRSGRQVERRLKHSMADNESKNQRRSTQPAKRTKKK